MEHGATLEKEREGEANIIFLLPQHTITDQKLIKVHFRV